LYKRKTLNLGTYYGITRLKTQVNNVAIVMGYTLSLAKAGGDVSFVSVATTLIPVLLSFATFFYGGSIYVINALSDIEDDKKEKPHRPLPSGKMSVQHAIVFAVVNLGLSFCSAALLGGMKLVSIYAAFLVINLIYSFVLRPWMSIAIPLVFISVTLPLRLYLGTAIAGYELPWPIFALTYQIYIGYVITMLIPSRRRTPLICFPCSTPGCNSCAKSYSRRTSTYAILELHADSPLTLPISVLRSHQRYGSSCTSVLHAPWPQN
jgi:4-hydroxybenzoate polyprenyltransferase